LKQQKIADIYGPNQQENEKTNEEIRDVESGQVIGQENEGEFTQGQNEGQENVQEINEAEIGNGQTLQGSRSPSEEIGGEEPSGSGGISGNQEIRGGQNGENGTEGAQKITLQDAINEAELRPKKKAVNKLIDKHFKDMFIQMTIKEPTKFRTEC